MNHTFSSARQPRTASRRASAHPAPDRSTAGNDIYVEMSRANHRQEKSIFLGGGVGALLGIGAGLVFGMILTGNGAMGAAFGMLTGICVGMAAGAVIGPRPVIPTEADLHREEPVMPLLADTASGEASVVSTDTGLEIGTRAEA